MKYKSLIVNILGYTLKTKYEIIVIFTPFFFITFDDWKHQKSLHFFIHIFVKQNKNYIK
jgi:hypothetical protein